MFTQCLLTFLLKHSQIFSHIFRQIFLTHRLTSMKKEIVCESTMSSRPRPPSSAMRGARLRNIIAIVVVSCVLCLLYLLSEANQKWSYYQYETEKCLQRRDSLSAQLQVTYEHKARLDKALHEEKALHSKDADEHNQFKEMQQTQREQEKAESLKETNSLHQQVSMLQNQNEDFRAENNQLNKKNSLLFNEAKQIEIDYKTQIEQKNLQLHSLRENIESLNVEKAKLQNKVIELTEAVKSLMQTNEKKGKPLEVDEGNADASGNNTTPLTSNTGLHDRDTKASNADDVHDNYIQKLAESANPAVKADAPAVNDQTEKEDVVQLPGNSVTEAGIDNGQPDDGAKDNPLPAPPPKDTINGDQDRFGHAQDNDDKDSDKEVGDGPAPVKAGNNGAKEVNALDQPADSKENMVSVGANSVEGLPNKFIQNKRLNRGSNDINVIDPLHLNRNPQRFAFNEPLKAFVNKNEVNNVETNEVAKNDIGEVDAQNVPAKMNQQEGEEYEEDAAEEQENKNEDEEYGHHDQEKIQEERNKRFNEWNQRHVDPGNNIQQESDVDKKHLPIKHPNVNADFKENQDNEEQAQNAIVAPH